MIVSDLGFFIPAVLGGTAFLFRLPGLIRNPGDPLLWSVSVLLATACGVFFFGSIPVIAKVNEITGVPNFSGPVVYVLLTAFSGSCVVLLINWRGGSPAKTRRATKICIGVYTLVCILIFTLFACAEPGMERLRDLDTYFANTPYMREMIVLYLLAHTASAVVMTYLCWRWSREVAGEMRVGLNLMVFGYLLTMLYDVLKFAAVGARWAGRDWDILSTDIARPLASVASLFIATGFGVPLVVQRFADPVKEWNRFRQLGPLWYCMRDLVLARGDIRSPLLTSVGMRLLQRERDIHDALLTLNPYFPAGVRSSTRDRALAAGATQKDADAAADAAMILAALRAFREDPDHTVISTSQELQTGVGIESRNLIHISQAIRHSPIGAAPSIAARG